MYKRQDGEEGNADNDIRSDENFEDDSDESLYELDSATTVVNAAPVVDAATSAPVVNVATAGSKSDSDASDSDFIPSSDTDMDDETSEENTDGSSDDSDDENAAGLRPLCLGKRKRE